ncbi:hypothetical protein [Bacillus sp. CGMCC 1.16541]|uniref:hypothetical protein n=1 Tax=Bacillus sp. CGMCC 1.16541 TaxID=2185143 RepID=UPI000D7326BF|nr:hypothetical protein [Bacillus sp. CGMCC 1.16541]
MQLSITLILLLATFITMFYVFQKRKKLGLKGWKSAMPSLCMFGVSLSSLGIITFSEIAMMFVMFNLIFLLTGAYFIKYLPRNAR